jgi:hypothetical protein
MNIILWIIQVILALLFVFFGATKLVLPMGEMAKQLGVSVLFLRALGLLEVLGGLGLILPGIFRIRPGLTSLAALGLVIIMIGATTIVIQNGAGVQALIPVTCGILAAIIAFGRWRLVPLRGR